VRGTNSTTGSFTHSQTINCPAGKKVVGGGGGINGYNGAGPFVIKSEPKSDGSGWFILTGKTAGSLNIIGYAICANVT
jgi:hypothetical protein